MHVAAVVLLAHVAAFAVHTDPWHDPFPVTVKNLLSGHCTHVPLADFLYPALHVAAVVLLAHVAAFAVHTDPWHDPEPDTVKNLLSGQSTHVPLAESW